MSSQPENELIHIIFTTEDVEAMIEDLPEDLAVSLEDGLARARDWAKSIEGTATQLINEQLWNVVMDDQP